jgi:hypothetical protein
MNMEMNELLECVVKRITNPQLNSRQKITYAGDMLKCMALVADKWELSVEDVLTIVERKEEEEVPLFEPDEHTDDESRILWDFVVEMEPYDEISSKDQREN